MERSRFFAGVFNQKARIVVVPQEGQTFETWEAWFGWTKGRMVVVRGWPALLLKLGVLAVMFACGFYAGRAL